jgi:hypothetical protein
VAGSNEHCNERLGSINGGEILAPSSDYQLYKKNCAPLVGWLVSWLNRLLLTQSPVH